MSEEIKQSVVVRNIQSTKVEIDADAHTQKFNLLGLADEIKQVTTPQELAKAIGVVRQIKGITRTVDTGRKLAKAGVKKVADLIDTTASEFSAELNVEDVRITAQIDAYKAEEERKVREAETKRQAELKRQADEKARLEREAEEARLKAEAASFQSPEAEKVAVEQVKVVEAAIAVVAAPLVLTPAVQATKVEGASTRSEPMFELLDINKLHMAHPELVRMEPNAEAIKKAIRAGKTDIQGLRTWFEKKTIFRS